eukprot:TRINITY_DN17769_c0_g1_i1.p1 TRINITY_DN17769_c0_g1~~TRINITY_DN17769_c0_g1_i1.p1  ORF type:complete len:276 (-),score=42.33 TRINITY_DN17769_c0_g1_i1:458-1285(-)
MLSDGGTESHRRIKAERKPFESNRKTRRRSRLRKDGEPSPTGGWTARGGGARSTTPSSRVARFDTRTRGKGGETPRGIFGKEPEIQVHKTRGGLFEVRGSHRMDVHPDIPYSLLTDFANTPRIFRTVTSCEVEELGSRCLVTQHMRWRFLFLSGTYSTKLVVRTRPERREIEFELAEPGFMREFKGLWTSMPREDPDNARLGCSLELRQQLRPVVIPPGPLAHYAERVMLSQLRNVYNDLEIEATREQLKRDVAADRERKAAQTTAVVKAAAEAA